MQRVKKPKQQHYNLTKKQLEEMLRKATDEAVTRSICLFIAYMMDEEEINYDAEKIIQIVDKINEWSAAVEDHLISINKVAEIIQEHTGLNVTW